jgi:hypothetical protein
VTDLQGKRVEVLPIIGVDQQNTRGYRGLTTGSYPPGTYQVRAELEYFRPGHPPLRLAVSPWSLLTVPSRGPEVRPAIRHSVPRSIRQGRTTTGYVEFTLPEGYELARNPRVVVLDPHGYVYNMLPIFFTRGPAGGKGQRELQLRSALRDPYRVRAEMDTLTPDGENATFVSGWTVLAVR